MPGYALSLFPQHVKLLEGSAISPGVARARGYVSVDTRKRLAELGFARYQRAVPGLLIPERRADGSVWGYQYRPDVPRVTRAGSTVKYETPAGQRNGIDVPPGIKETIGDPAVPLLVTEGSRKADAAVSAGVACVSLNGVWGWVGTNGQGGRLAVADWRDVALNDGRRVVLAFDSDVVRKRAVRAALSELARYLASKGARVEYLHLPDDEPGKTGLDDYIAAHGADGLWHLVRPDLPAVPPAAAPPPIPPAVPPHPHTPPAWAADRDILARLVADMGKRCGFTGEQRNAKVAYLAVTSRILDDPVSIAFKGQSGSGKSYTVASVLKFFPEDAVIVMTAMSERALIYMREPFEHRTLVLYEAVALREQREKTESNLTAYIVRSLLSEGQIRYPVAVRGPDGQLVTRTITKEGPTNLIITTTAASVHGENETRLLSLPTDDSKEQTTAIMKAIADGQADGGDFAEWHAYARWLAAGNTAVRVPYARWLAENIPPVAVRLRRDFRAVLRLIQAHALMHQLSRKTDEQGRIVADEADYLAVRALVADLVSDAAGSTVRPAMRETVEAVGELDHGNGVKVHDLVARLGLERSSVQYRVSAARDRGYLVNDEDKRGRPARYKLGSPLPGDVVILPERIGTGGVEPRPGPVHHTPGDAAPQASDAAAGGCEGVNEQRGGQGEAPLCAVCGLPMNPKLAAATGWTAHPECDPDGTAQGGHA